MSIIEQLLYFIKLTKTATEGFLLKSCSEKFRNILRTTPVLVSLFNKVTGL